MKQEEKGEKRKIGNIRRERREIGRIKREKDEKRKITKSVRR